MTKSRLMATVAVCAGFVWSGAASAQTTTETVTVTGDAAHLIELTPNSTAFGLPLSLIDTPRAATVISDTTISRYGIQTVDALTAISPSTYTASYYSVEGAVDVRGTLAETYFRGFKRVENRGTYTTPIGDASQIEILRGPPSPIYGAGKVGGLMNFIPKTAETADGYLTDITGQATITYGSYNKRNVTGQIGVPVDLGFAKGGIYAYGEIDDSFSFYRGIHPSHQMLETSADFDMGDGLTVSGDYMYYHSNGDVQSPGWNRLTQDLINNGTYITGRDTSLVDANGDGKLELNELGGNPYYYDPNFKALYEYAYPTGATSFGCGPDFNCQDAQHSLDVGVGTTKLSPRTIYLAPGVDFSNTITNTGFLQFSKGMGDLGNAKLELFYDSLSNDRYVSYGFPASYRTQVFEGRLSDAFGWDGFGGELKTNTVFGADYRYTHAIGKETYNSGVIALDRRDISFGPTANDLFASPWDTVPAGSLKLGWENDVRTNTGNGGLFVTSDLDWNNLRLIVGGRYDDYNIRSVDLGVLPYEAPAGRGTKDVFTYSTSLNYTTPWGLVPYVTYAKNAAVEVGQADQVSTSLFASNGFVSSSYLTEGGVKFTFLDDHLVGSLSYYRQERTRLNEGGGVINIVGTRSKGEELEIRYVATDNWSFTVAGDMQHTIVKGPDDSFTYIPARTVGVSPVAGFGGSYVTFDFAGFPGPAGNYEYTLIPHAVVSPYVTFTSDPFDWGVVGGTFGGSYVSKTAQIVPDPIVFPNYFTLNMSLFAQYGTWEVNFNINNLTDKLYFTSNNDSYESLAATPSIGRTFRLTLKKSF
jgi:iron complex outermembrane recepter protein